MRDTRYARALLLLPQLTGAGQPTLAAAAVWELGRTTSTVTDVYSKDPTDELARKTTYLDRDLLALLGEADGETLACPQYFVIRFARAGRFRLTVTCRADGNHQVIAFSPRSRSFKLKDFRDLQAPRTFRLDFDAADSRYLVLSCTAGNLFVDALAIEEADSDDQPSGGAKAEAEDNGPRVIEK